MTHPSLYLHNYEKIIHKPLGTFDHYNHDFIASACTIPQSCKLHIKIIPALSQKSHIDKKHIFSQVLFARWVITTHPSIPICFFCKQEKNVQINGWSLNPAKNLQLLHTFAQLERVASVCPRFGQVKAVNYQILEPIVVENYEKKLQSTCLSTQWCQRLGI